MRKILCRAMLCLCLVLALGPVHTAFAQDLDRIESYDVDVTPNTEDGSLRIQVTLEWTVLAEGPVSWVKIGVPNGSIRQEQALTDNIDRLSFDNSYMYVYFNRDYDDGETFRFSYSWIQEYMYTLGADGSVEYVYTPGWFSEARVGQMTLTWHDPAGVDGVDSLGNTGGDHAAVLTDLDHGQQLDFTVRYDSWPAQLAQEGSRDNLPQDNDPEYDPGYDPDYQDGGLGLVGLVILLVVAFIKRNIYIACTWGLISGTIIGLVSGILVPSDIMGLQDGTLGGFLIDGVNNMIGTVGYLYAIAGIIGILSASGLLQRTIDALVNSKLNRSVVGTEIIISVGLMVSSICLGSANGPAIIMWGPIADDLGKSKKLHPYRRANLMDGFGSTLPAIIPVTSAFIFIALSCVQGLMDSYTFVQKISPVSLAGASLHCWFLFVVLAFSVLSGWGRKYEGPNGEPVKALPAQTK